jgi:hypothetical protein
MVLVRLRRSARVVALVLLASFWGLLHGDRDDACAFVAFEAHDESTPVVGGPGGGDRDHCVVCHSVRTPRRPLGAVAQLQSPIALGALVDLSDTAAHRAPALDCLPARAPPATLI